MTLTLEMLREAMRKVEAAVYVPAPMLERDMSSARQVQMSMNALRIVFSPYALEATAERLFPASKNRSRRIRKKLVKRFGGEFRMIPAMWRSGNMIFAHPAFKARLQASDLIRPFAD